MKNISLFALFAALFALSSCTEEIDIKVPSSAVRLVVEGGIGIDTCVHTIILSKTMDYFSTDTAMPYVSGAAVSITEFDENKNATGNIFLLTENPIRKGHYETDPTVFGKQGYTYRLDISNVNIGGHESYTAEAFFPYIADKIDAVHAIYGIDLMWAAFDPFGTLDSTWTGWNLLFTAQDPPTPEYYVFITYKNGVALNDTLTEFFMVADDMIGQAGVTIKNFPIAFLADSTWAVAKEGDTLGLEIRSISKDYYNYISEFNTVYGGTNPMFGGAPANVRGNINNGAIGYFYAYGNRKAFTIARKFPTFP